MNVAVRERISQLLKNPKLGTEFIKKPDLNDERGLKSNCCGTVIYVLGLENIARKEADNPRYLTGEFFECSNRPGCLDMDTMERIISPRISKILKPNPLNMKPFSIISFWTKGIFYLSQGKTEIRYDRFYHVGILMEDRDYMFHQNGYGAEFECVKIQDYQDNYPKRLQRYPRFHILRHQKALKT